MKPEQDSPAAATGWQVPARATPSASKGNVQPAYGLSESMKQQKELKGSQLP